jgi:hypothetical protein
MSRRTASTARAVACLFCTAVFAAGFFVYFLLPEGKLPGFLPGRHPGGTLHLIQFALLCAFLALVSMVAALANADTARRAVRYRASLHE